MARWLAEPRDAAGLAAFRLLFGATLFLSTTRFLARGWVESLYLAPSYHFAYPGVEWVSAASPHLVYGLFALMLVSSAALCVGAWTRLSAALFCLAFSYVELIDKAPYLNHYYLVSLLSFLTAWLPSAEIASFDAWSKRRRGRSASRVVPRWAYLVLVVQVSIVYFSAGAAKVSSDWLFRAEPIHGWLQAYAAWPVLGPLSRLDAAATVVSWFAAIYDLTIPLWLLWSRSRPYALGAVLLFHGAIALLFPIGVFSLVMVVASSVFLDPSWPRWVGRRLARRWLQAGQREGERRSGQLAGSWRRAPSRRERAASLATRDARRRVFLGAFLLVQALLPWRHWLYPGDVNWTEEGFRFAWRVMLVEKTGQVEYRVDTAQRGTLVVRRFPELTPLQRRMMSTQPDMIRQYALELARRFESRGDTVDAVYADAFAALNGHPSSRLVDPRANLLATEPAWAHSSWIVPPE